MAKSSQIGRKIDWWIILIYILLVTFGFMNLYSSDYNVAGDNISFFQNTYGRQLLWIIVGLVLAIGILLIDAVVYSMFAYFVYVAVISILFFVFVFGVATHGARSWFEIGNIKIQPSEFAKFATALALARFISINGFDFSFKNFLNVAITFVIIFLPVVLIILQPDVGSAMVYAAFILVLYREGLPGVWLLLIFIVALVFFLVLILHQMLLLLALITIAIFFMFIVLSYKKHIFRIILSLLVFFSLVYFLNLLLSVNLSLLLVVLVSMLIWLIYILIYYIIYSEKGVLMIVFFLLVSVFVQFSTQFAFNKVLKQHQRNRIEVLFDNSIDPQGIGYNLRQSKIAIGSGGFWGKGFLKGTQTKLDFVPEHNTDFIFCTVAEEWGFAGIIFLFVMYAILIIRIVYKSEQQVSDFSRIYGYSLASILFLHFFVNIGMTIGMLPVIGIPLPFFSYGGSAMLSFTILLFIFVKLDYEKELKF
ncbi:MAG: rod shape-determining protein RodA [Bacteroidota bacterium]|nr:rod shape-determining protein RodA [Bacteroidota bacterium]